MSAIAKVQGVPFKINYESNKVLFLIVKVKEDYFSITFFDEKLRKQVKNLKSGSECIFNCTLKPSKYINKNGQWVEKMNLICVGFDVIAEEIEPKDLQNMAMIDDGWIPFK